VTLTDKRRAAALGAVAELAGSSPSTVSNVLPGKAKEKRIPDRLARHPTPLVEV